MEISAQNITVTIDSHNVLARQSVTAVPGSTLALTGPSGSGKTTLLNVLGMLRRVNDGKVIVEGKNATDWNDRQRRRFWQQSAAFVFQDYGLIDEESVAVNVALSKLPLFGRPKSQRNGVEEVLERVGLGGRAADKVSTLSGGEKQRVGLARAMFRSADVILADEPTASLDLENRNLVTRFLLEEASRGATVVIATHDETLMSSCHQRIHLGSIGTPARANV
ncbi:hypothetical protein DM794_15365 [Paenarthrobacter ureafaciens]|uniref:ABC transporter ATP-binding protein n=1 Tax=Paenarthrobacter ureafaciens TaxID=37931 RepID=UPI0015BF666D|nr:ATP-binding cassette domain-containing protein [Paenarthrobacter ureafaciens]MEC3852424.1 ATP-binding cassette domain-containing protein [Paenarthrobacter ureafaciens]NWL28427.1 hypothetical protein [Paenarthrobacter ureafaciens]